METPKVIYFVDDDKAILNVLEYTLSSLKEWNIKTFKSGEDFLQEIDNNPDIVVLDYVLNSNNDMCMDGFDVLKKIKEYSPDIKVVILSQYDDQSIIDRFLSNGALAYILKEAFFIDILITELDKLT